jgi:hypothetical protein
MDPVPKPVVTVGMPRQKRVVASIPVRQCANIKSKKHPDVRCPLAAGQGEFCSRHAKNPTRFQEESVVKISGNKRNHLAAKKIQTWWKSNKLLLRFKRQGPAATFPELADNQSDLYTMETTSTIPLLYRWSYGDAQKHIWIFDVRSLSMLKSSESKAVLENPYTRSEISGTPLKSFLSRCQQLRAHKYCLVHNDTVELSEEQLWHQQVLDMAMKYDALGYSMSLSWFDALSIQQLYLFYYELWELWMYRLQLSSVVRHAVVPGWASNDTPLFRWLPNELRGRREPKWWRKMILDLLNRLVSATQKDHRTLGALYAMTAFAIVSPTVRQHYTWLVEMPEDQVY